MENENIAVRSLTPHFPIYPMAQHFLRILDNVPYDLYRRLVNTILEQRGNPQETVDWADPDTWIYERLTGDEQNLAVHIWHSSSRELNPRYLRGCWMLCTKHDLVERTEHEVLNVTERGEQFLGDSIGNIMAEIDGFEGVLNILQAVGERGPGWRSKFLDEFSTFCQVYTSYRSETVIKTALYDRLVNLVDREYVIRNGLTYEITEHGLAYLDRYGQLLRGRATSGKQSQAIRLARDISRDARIQLEEYLSQIDPFRFEELVKFLLEEMGYNDVKVTSPTNDKGVDVVADIQLGISQVREVVQVKRHKGNIQRKVLDELRGSLHRFNAVRATIITTGGFSSGTIKAAFEERAAPITLIDGEKLLDLLIEHNIGVSTKSLEYIEFEPDKLAQFDSKEVDESVVA